MPEEPPKPIVALRVVRPYESEDQFLAEEPFAISRTSLVLVGASSRPEGVILRFEVVLKTGAILLRGEGRVIGHGPTPLGESGLTLKFTRLDPRSKALVDRAGASKVADAPRASEPPPPVKPAPASEPRRPSLPPPPEPPGGHATVPAMQAVRFTPNEAPTSRGDSPLDEPRPRASSLPPRASSLPPRASSLPPPPVPSVPPARTEVPPAPTEPPSATEPPPAPVPTDAPPGSRDDVLARLRERLAGKSALAVLAALTGKS